MSVVPSDRPDIVLHGPADPELARLWDLAVAKLAARLEHLPGTREEWNAVTLAYQALLGKPRGALSTIVDTLQRQRCHDGTVQPGGG